MIGHYRRISPNRLTELQNNPESIVTFLFPGDEADEISESDGRYLNIDKTWHGLHFLLTGSALPNDPPLTNVVMGGTPLGDPENPDFDFGPARFLSPQEVQEVAKELSKISKTDLEARFDPSALLTADVYPYVWQEGKEALEYITYYYIYVVEFFQEAAKCGDVVLLYIS
ncbi:YfbM family protein [Nostoc sp. DSM 114167]|uniref:YfbM family protein n=1 Tax=Nostoc sp. DSM 114167 TaxID=3439050 RepID=UPI004045386F